MINPKKRGLSRVFLAYVLSSAFAVGAAYAQPREPAFGKPGEPARIRVAITPSQAGSWTGFVAYEKKYWEKHLPAGSRVDLDFAIRGPVIAEALRNGRLHIGYMGDLPAVALAASSPDAVLVGVAALSQDLCVLVVRRDAPEFATPLEGVRWLAGKRFAVSPGTCQERVALAAFSRARAQPARMLNIGLELYATAFKEGRIDAAGGNEMGASSLVEAGLARRLYSSRAAGAWDAVFIAASAALARERPDLLRGWLEAELEAQRFMADAHNADEVIRIVARHLPGVPERALGLAFHGAYPESQGGAVVRRVLPFTFSKSAMAVVREVHQAARQRGLAPAGELRRAAIEPRFAEEILRARGLKSPLGEVRARADIVPR